MGKTLKTVGMVIGAAALIATGAGAILMPGLSGGITLFGVSTGTLNMISAGVAAVGGLLDKPESRGSGSPDEWTSNPDQPTPFAFGRVGVSGKIIHRDEYGPDNRLQGIVSVYSGAGPIQGFVSYEAGDVPVSFMSNGGTAIGKYNRQMWRSWRLGDQPDDALSLPSGLDGGAVMPAWGAAYRLSGKACELLTVQQDSKFTVYPTGVPTPKAVLDGINGYDPRYDGTYPGGSGVCRLGDRSTYRYIDNPIIAALNWALGLVENGQVVGGVGASVNGIDVPAFVEAANIADANGWKVSAWPDTSEDVSAVLKQFLQAGGASYARHAGKISCVSRGAARASVVTITARDTAGPLELDTGSSGFNRLNQITPEFMSSQHGWKHVPTDPVAFPALRAEDGGKKSDSIQYRFVPQANQAAQLAAYDILDAREPFSGTIPLKPHLRRLKRGDCFVIDEPGFLLDGVKCMVLSRTYDAQTGEVRLAFRSETDGKHDLALGKTTTMPTYPGLTPVDPTLVNPPNPLDWTVIVRPPAPEGGGQLPGFLLQGVVNNATAHRVLVETGPTDDGPWTQAYFGPPTAETIEITVDANTTYFIAVSYFNAAGNQSARTVYGPYDTNPLIAGGLTGFESLQPLLDAIEVTQALGEALGQDAGARILDLLGGQDLVAQSIFRLAADIEARQRYTRELGFIEGERVGTYAQRRTTELFTGQTALVEDVSLIGARTEDGLGWLLRGDTVQIGGGQTLVSALVQLQAQTSETAASVVELTEVTAGQAEASARQLSLLGAEVPGSSIFRLSETTLQVGTRGSLGSVLDSLIATDGSNSSSISSLLSLTSSQASSLTALSSTVGGHTSSISSLFSVTNGLGARWTVGIDADGAAIGLVADGATRAWLFKGASFTILDDGNGLSYTPATGRMKIVKGSQKTVLGAGGSLVLWAGSTGISDGDETVDNGILGIGSGDSYFGGRTLSGPFGSGAGSPSVISIVGWTTVAEATARTFRNGGVVARASWRATLSSDGAPPPTIHGLVWRIVTTDMGGGDLQMMMGGFVEGPANIANINMGAAFTEANVTVTGLRRILLQLSVSGTDNTAGATVHSAQFDGLYAA